MYNSKRERVEWKESQNRNAKELARKSWSSCPREGRKEEEEVERTKKQR